jgi:hypothetical protein
MGFLNVPCKICGKRRAKRHCPGVSGEICAVCCGTERENTIDCPHDCEHLRAARQHDHPAPLDAENLPNTDIRLTEEFISGNEHVVMWLAAHLARAIEKERAVDSDAREALDAIIRTYRTRESGLIYETRPQNPYAAAIQDALRVSIEELHKRVAEEHGMQTLRDADVLGALVFLQRLELQHSNGRRRGRAFYDFLVGFVPAKEESPSVAV